MPSSDDINNLFARFGGRPENYHEIERADEARESESRWPLLSALSGHVARPAAHGAQARTEPSLELPPTMPDPTRPDTSRPAAAAPATVSAAPARWADAPAAQPKPGAPAQAAVPAAQAAPDARFQFIAPRPRGGAHPGHVRPSPPDTVAEVAAREAAEATAPARPFQPFGAASSTPPTAARTEPSLAQYEPAMPGASDSPLAAFRSASPATAPAAEAPAEGAAASTGLLSSVFQRLSTPSERSPETEPRGIFQRLVKR